ncbi:hypothetical protein ACOMHN_035652 [Nucella lapillus]
MVRVKYRYFLVEIRYQGSGRVERRVSSEQVFKAVRQTVKDAHGDYGLGVLKDSLMVKYMNWETNCLVIRAKRDYYQLAQTAFTLVKKIGVHSCFLHTLYIGGTMNSCQKFLGLHNRHHLTVLVRQCKIQGKSEQTDSSPLVTSVKTDQDDSAPTSMESSLAQSVTGDLEKMDCSSVETSEKTDQLSTTTTTTIDLKPSLTEIAGNT